MADWAAGGPERKRIIEDSRDLHQSQSILAAVSYRGQTVRQGEAPAFAPMQGVVRICSEMPEGWPERAEDRAWKASFIALQHSVLQRNMVSLGD
jgi:hypothetical protein